MNLIAFLLLFWIICVVKQMFFWLYLWQLKEYHIGRFLDHFSASKGKRIFFSPIFGIKIFLLPSLFLFSFAWRIVALFYLAEAVRGVYSGTALLPAFTKKVIALAIAGSLLVISFLSFVGLERQPRDIFALLLLFDIASPLIFSFLVLLFQPFAVLGRKRIIERAKKKRAQFPRLKVIGVTGSYGKTSTKELLAHILSKKFNVLKTKEHRNSEVGVSQTILEELKPEHEIFVCEMGAYTKGGIKLLCDIAKPRIGILTGINEQHMATFGSQENIIQAKYELIESLPADGVAFFNAKNRYCVALYDKTNIKKVLYGQSAKFLGEENMLGAVAVAKELGMSDEEVALAFQEINSAFPGVQVKRGKGGITIIDATYSANPNGVIANLEYLKTFSGKKVVVMPCLIELGRASKEVHRRIGKKIAEVCDFAIITTQDRLEDISEGAGGSQKILFLEDPKKIAQQVKSTTTTGDVVLLEGRGPIRVQDL